MFVNHFLSLGHLRHPDRVPEDPVVPVGTLLGPDREAERRKKGLDEVAGEGDPRKNCDTLQGSPTLCLRPTFGSGVFGVPGPRHRRPFSASRYPAGSGTGAGRAKRGLDEVAGEGGPVRTAIPIGVGPTRAWYPFSVLAVLGSPEPWYRRPFSKSRHTDKSGSRVGPAKKRA